MAKAWFYTGGTLAILTIMFVFRKFFTQPVVAWLMLVGSLATDGLLDDGYELRRHRDQARQRADRRHGVSAGVLHLAGDLSSAVQNDDRLEQGLEPLEKLDDEKMLVWPDLVYTEMICMVALDGRSDPLGHRTAGPAGGGRPAA